MNVKLQAYTYVPEKDYSHEKIANLSKEDLEKLFENCKLKAAFSLHKALLFCSKMAGICYMKDNFDKILNESEENTLERLNTVLNSGHHSVFDHFYLTFEIENIPKLLAMILNNEHAYNTSEKSARFTMFKDLPEKEGKLYEKWRKTLTNVIIKKYPSIVDEKAKFPNIKAKKLAQENARYFISVFTPTTTLAYTVSLRQLNYLVMLLTDFLNASYSLHDIDNLHDINVNLYYHKVQNNLKPYIKGLIQSWSPYFVNGLIPRGKNRRLSLFGRKEFENIQDIFSYVYQTKFSCSYSCFAQNQRHRTEHCFLYPLPVFNFYVPEIIRNTDLEHEWLEDAFSVKDLIPQGTIITTVQTGNIDTFLMKISERICGAAQLEIMRHEVEILNKYMQSPEYGEYIISYTNGKSAKCQFINGFCGGKCMLGANQVKRLI